MSLAVPSVYSIPMLLFVGWRGEPGKRDEPQHVVQGKATPGLLGMIKLLFAMLFRNNIYYSNILGYELGNAILLERLLLLGLLLGIYMHFQFYSQICQARNSHSLVAS